MISSLKSLNLLGLASLSISIMTNKKIAIEVQGSQHTKYVEFFHGNRFQYLQQLKRDEKKLKFCEANDIALIEIYPKDKNQ